MNFGKDLIYCANRAEELRKALHSKNKICQHDCKQFRLGMLTVLGNLGFLTYEDEPIDITNTAGAWDKELRGLEASEENAWISVTVRLPIEANHYLTVSEEGIHVRFYSKEWGWNRDYGEVYYWMPLPEAPKGV